jgi:tRNA 2-thiocytidine biosynthesis protein TtcA
MLADGDRVLVALSGGKDSLTLLHVLQERQARVPVRYSLQAGFIDPGFNAGQAEELERWCRRRHVTLHVERTDHGWRAHSAENRENPCFLCARLRRQRLFELADRLGCNVVALGHHQDDRIETFLMGMLYAGEVSAMAPNQSYFGGRFSLIRPLALADEATIARFAREQQFPVFTNPCPSAGHSKRREVKMLLASLYRDNHKIRGNLFRALSRCAPRLPAPAGLDGREARR